MKYFIDKWISQWCINDWFQWCTIILMKDIDLILLLFKKCILTAPTFAIVLTDFIGWNRRMRRVKRIEVLYFLSFFFSLNLLFSFLLFFSRLAVDDVEIAATAFFILDKSTTEKKRRRNYSSFSFFLVYSLRVVNMHLSKRDHPICDFHFYFGEKKGIEQKTVYTHTNRKGKANMKNTRNMIFIILSFSFLFLNIQTYRLKVIRNISSIDLSLRNRIFINDANKKTEEERITIC